MGACTTRLRLERVVGRLIVTVVDSARIDEQALLEQGARVVAVNGPTSVHVLHADVDALEGSLAPLPA